MGFKEDLYKPFTEVDKRQGRGGYYDYIKWRHVADRMNEVFDGRWSSKVVAENVTTTDVVVRIAVTVVDPSDGTSFTQEGYGGAAIRSGEESGTAHKSAYSKALKDACRKWGVGLYLDGDGDSGGNEQPTYSTPSIPTSFAGQSMPGPITQQPAPVGATMAPPAPVQQTPVPPVTKEAPAPTNGPAIPSGFGGGMPAPISMGPGAGMAPPVTGVSNASAPVQAPVEQPEAPVVADASPDEPGTLTDVQKMAIVHMAKARGAETEDAVLATIINVPATGLSRVVPSIENLSYIEAVAVIKYIKLLNEKE